MATDARPPSAPLVFRDLGFTANPTLISRLTGGLSSPQRIIDSVSGLARAGEVLFIMGPSGAGKTSALDSIAGRVAAEVSGTVHLHGSPATSAALQRSLKYVPQTPHLYETLTVDETLHYAASFYVSDAATRRARVDEAVAALGLANCRDVMCGGAFYRGLSGGQRRRVAVAVELVARPAVLLLDEPTSGLDSTGARRVVEHLRDVARTGVAVVCTIHQPTQHILDASDSLLLLSSGRVAYFGRTADVVPYFSKHGCVLPDRTSVAEWLLDEISTDFAPDPTRVEHLLDAWRGSAERAALDAEIDAALSGGGDDGAAEWGGKGSKDGSVFARGLLSQTALLARRNVTEAARNPAVIYLRLAMYVALALLIGAAWWRMDNSAGRVFDRLAALFYTSAFMIFMSIAVLPVYLNEKAIVTRERANASYSALAYVSGHFVMEVSFMAAMSIVLTGVLYYMAGFNPAWSRFVFFAVNLFTSLLVAESVMMLVAAVVPFLLAGIAAGAFLFGLFMVVQGFLRPVSRITWVLRWAQYLSLHTFSYNAFTINELGGQRFVAAPDNVPPILRDVDGDEFFTSLALPLDNKWACVAVMVAMLVVYRSLAYAWIATKWHGKK